MEDVPIRLLLENPLKVEAMVDCTMELVFDTWGIRDGVTVELVKIETEVAFTEEYAGFIEVGELNIVVVLLARSTDLEDVPIRLLLENPLKEETIVD